MHCVTWVQRDQLLMRLTVVILQPQHSACVNLPIRLARCPKKRGRHLGVRCRMQHALSNSGIRRSPGRCVNRRAILPVSSVLLRDSKNWRRQLID